MKTADRKKRLTKGLTLTEVLVALLIFSLVAAAMATGVSAAVKVYKDSTRTSAAQTLCNTLSQEILDILRNSYGATDSATFSNDLFGENASFSAEDGRICCGGKKIMGSGAYTDMNAGIECSCAESIFTVTITISDTAGNQLISETLSAKVPEE